MSINISLYNKLVTYFESLSNFHGQIITSVTSYLQYLSLLR